MRAHYLATNLLNFFLAIVEGFLALRFLLKLFGASGDNGFVSWVYEMSAVLLAPFRGIFPVTVFENQYVLEFSTLFAMLMYAVIALVLMYLIRLVTAAVDPDDEPVEETVVRKRR